MAQTTRTEAYVTISLDKTGRVIRVEYDGRAIEPKRTQPGPARQGESTAECEEVVRILVHELLTCKKKKPEDPKKPQDPKDPYPPPGTDPCCYRDQATGEVWCWC